LKTCRLSAIIILEQGIFDYTTIKTCVFVFRKMREEMGGNDSFETGKVRVINQNLELLVDIDINEIIANDFILDYQHYLKRLELENMKRNEG
jgi:hypothetical protein